MPRRKKGSGLENGSSHFLSLIDFYNPQPFLKGWSAG
jgi:hypothetical protein